MESRYLIRARFGILSRMDAGRTKSDIKWLERIFALPDRRPLTDHDLAAANRRHDEKLAASPWFKLWQSYGICCRSAAPELQLPEADR